MSGSLLTGYFPKGRAVLAAFWVVATAWGTALNWQFRSYMNPDGVSYLDLGLQCRRHGIAGLVNAHWSPLYPLLISWWLALTHFLPFTSFSGVHFLNSLLFAVAAGAFAVLLAQMRLYLFAGDRRSGVAFYLLGSALFLHFMTADTTAFVVTPDVLLAAAAFAILGAAFWVMRRPQSVGRYFALGIVLTVGYWTKAMVLPAGVVFLLLFGCVFIRTPRALKSLAMSAAVLAVLSAPWIWLLSAKEGKLTFSESGHLNELWFVGGVTHFQGWTGGPGADRPVHGPRVILEYPKALEFATPIAGTYPLWFDPAYWHAGARVHFKWTDQLQAIRRNLEFYNLIADDLMLPAICVLTLTLVCIWRRQKPELRTLALAAWPLCILGLYLLLLNEYRYAAPFLVLFFLLVCSSMMRRMERLGIALAIVSAVFLLWPRLNELSGSPRRTITLDTIEHPLEATKLLQPVRPTDDEKVAYWLFADGRLREGAPIATVGPAFQHFYAKLLSLHVVSQIEDEAAFWNLTPETRREAYDALAATGARALVAINQAKNLPEEGWRWIPLTKYSVLFLPARGG